MEIKVIVLYSFRGQIFKTRIILNIILSFILLKTINTNCLLQARMLEDKQKSILRQNDDHKLTYLLSKPGNINVKLRDGRKEKIHFSQVKPN